MNYWKSGIVFGIILSICSFTGFYNNTPSFPSYGKDLNSSGVYDISGSVIYIDDTSEYYTWEFFSQLSPLCTGVSFLIKWNMSQVLEKNHLGLYKLL